MKAKRKEQDQKSRDKQRKRNEISQKAIENKKRKPTSECMTHRSKSPRNELARIHRELEEETIKVLLDPIRRDILIDSWPEFCYFSNIPKLQLREIKTIFEEGDVGENSDTSSATDPWIDYMDLADMDKYEAARAIDRGKFHTDPYDYDSECLCEDWESSETGAWVAEQKDEVNWNDINERLKN